VAQLEEKTWELGGIKTLISRNHYTAERFWRIYDEPSHRAAKARLDPHGVFRDLYEKLHRVGKADFFVQLEELEHVAADAAAEAVEEALVAIDLEGRRLLAMKRTETFVIGARFFQRHVVLDHHDDVAREPRHVERQLGAALIQGAEQNGRQHDAHWVVASHQRDCDPDIAGATGKVQQ